MSSSRDRILLAAERLIAERGVDVPLRDIAVAAGQRNNSAVHYHFGSREGLIQAVLELRTAPQEKRRMHLLAELEAAGRGDDLPSLVEVLLRPVCEVPYEMGATHFARFLVQLLNQPATADLVLDPERWPAGQIVATRIYRTLPHLPELVLLRRLFSLIGVQSVLLADHERRWDGTGSPAPDEEVVDDIIAMLVGMLQAPASLKTAASASALTH